MQNNLFGNNIELFSNYLMKIFFNFRSSFKHLLSDKTTRCSLIFLWFFVFSVIFLAGRAQASVEDLKQTMQAQITELERQINEYRAGISNLQSQSKTLKNEISLLDSKIKAAQLEKQRTALAVQETEIGLSDKNLALGQAELKLERERDILAKYIQTIYESDQQGVLEMILSNSKLSDVFDKVNSLQEVQQSIQESMASIRILKENLVQDKQSLEDRKDELNELRVLQEIQSRALDYQQEERTSLLGQTKGQESAYQNLLKKAKADSDSIKKNLYSLEGAGISMSLEQAYLQAKRASELTGVRPAFLLAILKKESSWGERVGTGTWRKDMHKRDQQPFIEICEKLGVDPDKMPVSRKPSYGWGGAMGPAQFLPAVWLSYEPQIAKLTGHAVPDPWDIEDAFVAAGIKMAQAGANAQTRDAEWKAAQIYFAGKRWNNPTYYFYGDQVMEMAAVIQGQLDIISQ